MKYYSLLYDSLNTEITGTQFQSVKGVLGDIQNEIIPFEGIIDFNFILPEPFLEEKAKLTTYLNAVIIPNWFLVLDKHFIDFLKKFKIGDYQVWDIKVHQKKRIINDYKLFTLNFPKQRDCIDFSDSEFYIGKFNDFEYIGESIIIDNYIDYLEKRENLSQKNLLLKYKTITLNFSGK